jgi:site-specific recombinase XerD
MAAWVIKPEKKMTLEEVRTIAADIQRRAKRSVNSRMNEVIFHLSTFAGIRATEIANLKLKDIKLESGDKPFVHVENGKGGKTADVYIINAKTTLVLHKFMQERLANNANDNDYLLVKTNGKQFNRHEIALRFKSAIKVLPAHRVKELSVHCGRHTFATVMLQEAGLSLAAVRDNMRHTNVSVTNTYLHAEDIKPIDIF